MLREDVLVVVTNFVSSYFCTSGLADLAAWGSVSPDHLAGVTVGQLPALSASNFTSPGCCVIICCAI